MGVTYRYVSRPSNESEVLDRFRSHVANIREVPTPRSRVLYFPDMGPLEHHDDGAIDPKTSPVVTIFEPRIRRGVLWTVGEGHFLSTPLRRLFPELHRLSSSFRQWLESSGSCLFESWEQQPVELLPRRLCPEPRFSWVCTPWRR